MQYNNQYIEYAADHGMSPDEMMRHDRRVWPGGCMCGYIIWAAQHKLTRYPQGTGYGMETKQNKNEEGRG